MARFKSESGIIEKDLFELAISCEDLAEFRESLRNVIVTDQVRSELYAIVNSSLFRPSYGQSRGYQSFPSYLGAKRFLVRYTCKEQNKRIGLEFFIPNQL